MTTVGLFDKDTHIYFVNEGFVVMDNPYNGQTPTLIKRTKGDPLEGDWVKIRSILKSIGMKLKGESFIRSDGLWYNELMKEAGDESRG